MPEVILPCPFCGNTSPRTTAKIDGVWCDKEECPNRQNTYAVDVWNSLPRALRWTHEPPKVAGLYMLRAVLTTLGDGQYGPIQLLNITQDMLVYSHRKDFQWAGPLRMPMEARDV